VITSDGVSRHGLCLETRLETHFCESWSRSSRFQVSSRSWWFQVSRLWLLQRNGLLTFYNSNDFLLNLQVRNNQNTSQKCQKFEKNFKSEMMTTFFLISAKCTNFEVSSLGIDLEAQVLSLGVMDGFRERGALGHLSFWGPTQVWPIWPFVWKAWKYAPLMCSASSKFYLLLCRLWFCNCRRSSTEIKAFPAFF